MKFSLSGIKFYVSFAFFFIVTLFLLVDKTGYAIKTLLAILIHESGHLFAMYLTGCLPGEINLIPGSVQIVSDSKPLKNEQIIISLAGPAVNLSAFVVIYLFKDFITFELFEFGVINLSVFLLNLIPAKGLDGGDIIHCLISEKLGTARAESIHKIITLFLALCFFLIFIFLIIKGVINLSLMIMSIYLCATSFLKIG